jgi:hypothetical protein
MDAALVRNFVKTSLFISFLFLGISPSRRSLGSYAVGKISLYFYVPMFPWRDFLMGQIRKIQKHKEERDISELFFKNERVEERKRRDF